MRIVTPLGGDSWLRLNRTVTYEIAWASGDRESRFGWNESAPSAADWVSSRPLCLANRFDLFQSFWVSCDDRCLGLLTALNEPPIRLIE